jgi:hypothetical protein
MYLVSDPHKMRSLDVCGELSLGVAHIKTKL